MIDFHSHILPQIDDGSSSVEESISMLKMLGIQGVDTVVATPHFSPNTESVSDFLNRREASFNLLAEHTAADIPQILPGAEVSYYEGISRLADIKHLMVGKSRLMLLEMPLSTWTEYKLKELVELSCVCGVTLVLAHIERYLPYQNKKILNYLLDNGILFQINASFITDFSTKKKAISMLKNGMAHFIGSDCHNLSVRAPKIGDAFEVVRKKIGHGFLEQFDEDIRSYLFV